MVLFNVALGYENLNSQWLTDLPLNIMFIAWRGEGFSKVDYLH